MRALILLSVLVLAACAGDEGGKPILDSPTPDGGVMSQPDAASDPITPDSGVDAGTHVARCGDGLVQRSLDEQCDDGNTIAHDGCRSDCIIEEVIGLGYSGGQCEVDSDCEPPGSKCETGVEGGSCVTACSTTCADRAIPTTPVTFCIDKEVYEDRLGHALAPEITDGWDPLESTCRHASLSIL